MPIQRMKNIRSVLIVTERYMRHFELEELLLFVFALVY